MNVSNPKILGDAKLLVMAGVICPHLIKALCLLQFTQEAVQNVNINKEGVFVLVSFPAGPVPHRHTLPPWLQETLTGSARAHLETLIIFTCTPETTFN